MGSWEIGDIPIAQLERELEKRGLSMAPEFPRPSPLVSPDWGPLVDICRNYIKELPVKPHIDADFENYIFKIAMETVFGKSVWEWINKQY